MLAVCTLSCSVGDDSDNSYNELLPVEEALVPTEFERGETYDINITYIRPTTCHAFNDIYYVSESNERTIAVVATVFQNNNCSGSETLTEASFSFKATTEDLYIFKFWQGEDENGEDQYLIVEVPVVD